MAPALMALGSILAVVVVVGGAYLAFANNNAPAAPTIGRPSPDASSLPSRDPLEPLTVASVQRYPHLVFQSVIRDDNYAQAALVPLDAPGGMRVFTGLTCERVQFAGGSGICLFAQHGTASRYFARIFRSDFQSTAQVELAGIPTFAAVSPDGRVAAASFQTAPVTEEVRMPPSKTVVIDTATGDQAADLDTFTVIREGSPVEHSELDIWGVTFKADADGFFASIRLDGNVFLAEGSIRAATLKVAESSISAPSLSPDGRLLAYSRLVSSVGPTWRFHVLNLESRDDVELAERKSIDDQITWLDEDDLLYGLGADIWTVRSDGTGSPQPFLFGGLSPSVVRP